MVTTAAATSGGRPVCVRRELGGGGAAIQRVASRQPALYQQAVLLQQRVCQRTRLVGCRGVVRSPGRMGGAVALWSGGRDTTLALICAFHRHESKARGAAGPELRISSMVLLVAYAFYYKNVFSIIIYHHMPRERRCLRHPGAQQ